MIVTITEQFTSNPGDREQLPTSIWHYRRKEIVSGGA